MRIVFPALAAFLLLTAAPAAGGNDVYLRISLISGDVRVSAKDLDEWSEASINMPLAEGDRLWVAEDGRAELQLEGGFFIRGEALTALDVLSLENGSIQFYLDQGHAYINNLRGGVRTVQIDTPLASVRSPDNSILTLDVAGEGKTEVSVLKGYAYAETRTGATRVPSGNTLTLSEDGAADLAPLAPPDEWETWNMERDRQVFAWGESVRYLPEELDAYAGDFDTGGQWVYTGEYGYCWTPFVTAVDWAPYTVGRWDWLHGNYVWISFEPWGWVPYHYGRWAFIAGTGWCWVPPAPRAVAWGPGFVGWIITPTYFAWVPLAPGEIYYGYGSFGPNSVNIVTVNVNAIIVERNYRNARVRHSVTVIDREDFEKGRWRPVRAREDRDNPFLERRHEREEFVPPHARPAKRFILRTPERTGEIRAPEKRTGGKDVFRREAPEQRILGPKREVIAPERKQPQERRVSGQPAETREAPAQRQPPERVMRTKPEEIKTRRRFVKEKEGSAFRPERPAELPVTPRKEPKVIIRKPGPQQAPHKPAERQQKKQDEEKEKRKKKDRD